VSIVSANSSAIRKYSVSYLVTASTELAVDPDRHYLTEIGLDGLHLDAWQAPPVGVGLVLG